MCSACITISPRASNSAVEASRRSLMFAECAERISTAPISSQIARSAPVSTWSSTGSIIARVQPDRAGAVDLAASPAARAASTRAARRPPGPRSGCRAPATRAAPRARAAPRRSWQRGGHAAAPAARRPPRARPPPRARRGDADRHELERLRRDRCSRSGPRARPRTPCAARQEWGWRRPGPGARTPGRGSAARRWPAARRRPRLRAPRRACSPSSSTAVAIASAVSAASDSSTRALHVAAARRDDQAERRQHARCARADDRLDPELVGDRRRVQRPGAPEREQRVAARVDPALDGDDPQRAHHLGVGDADDPLRARERLEPELAGERPDRAPRRRPRRARRRPPAARRRPGTRAPGSRR